MQTILVRWDYRVYTGDPSIYQSACKII